MLVTLEMRDKLQLSQLIAVRFVESLEVKDGKIVGPLCTMTGSSQPVGELIGADEMTAYYSKIADQGYGSIRGSWTNLMPDTVECEIFSLKPETYIAIRRNQGRVEMKVG